MRERYWGHTGPTSISQSNLHRQHFETTSVSNRVPCLAFPHTLHISAGGVNEKDAINGYYEQHSLTPSRPDSDRGSRGVGGNSLSLGTVKALAARS